MKVLIGCERSGAVRDAFLALGHEALSCDLEETDSPGPHYKGSVFDVIDFPWDIGIFHFPCTDASVSGAKHFAAKKMDGRYYRSASLWMEGWRRASHIPKVCFEHPVSVMSSLFRKPDQIIQPYEYGHPETKATCLWLKGLPKLKPTNNVYEAMMKLPINERARIHHMPPGPNRARERSATYAGIAAAIATQWSNSHD